MRLEQASGTDCCDPASQSNQRLILVSSGESSHKLEDAGAQKLRDVGPDFVAVPERKWPPSGISRRSDSNRQRLDAAPLSIGALQ